MNWYQVIGRVDDSARGHDITCFDVGLYFTASSLLEHQTTIIYSSYLQMISLASQDAHLLEQRLLLVSRAWAQVAQLLLSEAGSSCTVAVLRLPSQISNFSLRSPLLICYNSFTFLKLNSNNISPSKQPERQRTDPEPLQWRNPTMEIQSKFTGSISLRTDEGRTNFSILGFSRRIYRNG